MHRTIRAITLAGAVGLSLVPGSAGAQSQGWNLIRPQYCFQYSSSTTSTLVVYTPTYNFQVAGPVMQAAVLQWCSSGAPFWAYNDGPNHPWWMFWMVAGLK
jgi:hypothetical protein